MHFLICVLLHCLIIISNHRNLKYGYIVHNSSVNSHRNILLSDSVALQMLYMTEEINHLCIPKIVYTITYNILNAYKIQHVL
jgi:hypothetical protein